MTHQPAYVLGMTSIGTMTAEDLLRLDLPDKRTELVRGLLVVREPAGYAHGRVTVNLTVRLHAHVERMDAGQLFAAETGFTLSRGPDTVRAPDVAFIRKDRLLDPMTRGFVELAPDLVAEVLSPDDRPADVLSKVSDWLRAGARLVWVIDPDRRLARVYRPDGTESVLAADDVLAGEDVLPGFSCALAGIL